MAVNNTLIGAIRVEASLEGGKFVDGARKIRTETGRLEGDLKKRFGGMAKIAAAGVAGLIGALSVGTFIQIGSAALKYAASLGEVSQQIGVTTRDLQTLRYAASQLGVDQEVLDRGLAKLTETLGKVAAGAKQPTKALEAIGLNAQEIARLDTGTAFLRIADALSNVESRAQRAAVETALMAEAGSKLDPMLAGGSGALNELAAAAEELGIVLSDEQIRKADETADKLEALKTVLTANIAGKVADNADAILDLANALAEVVKAAADAASALSKFYNRALAEAEKYHREHPGRASLLIGKFGRPEKKSAADVKEDNWQSFLARNGINGLGVKRSGGIDVGKFLASDRKAGSGRKKRDDSDRLAREAERKRLEALREANRFDQEIRRAKIDVMRAEQQLSSDYVERTSIAVQILDAERAAYESQLKYEVSAGELQQVQADQLMTEYDKRDALERAALMKEEEAQRQQDFNRLEEVNFDVQRDALEAQLQLADTAKERRDLELRLLDLAYRQEQARLQAIIADEQSSWAAKEEARRRLASLNATYGADRQGVVNRTRGPMEDFRAQYGDISEELEDLKVRGIMGAADALTSLTEGWDSFRDAAINAIQSVLQELIRLQLMKLAVSLLGGSPSALSPSAGVPAGLPANFGGPRAMGGPVQRGRAYLVGEKRPELFVPNQSGVIVPRIPSSGFDQMAGIGNGRSSSITVHAPITIAGNASRETLDQAANTIRRRVGDVAGKGLSGGRR